MTGLVASAFASIWLFRRYNQWALFDRFMAALVPVCGVFFVVQTAAAVRSVPFWTWNDLRLARGFALAYGYKLYYDAQSGPVVGTLHAPLGYLIYASLAFIKSPTIALIAGSLTSALLVFGPIAWILLKAPSPNGKVWMLRLFIFLGSALMVFRSSGLIYSAFRIHTDAAALGFGAAATAVLYRGKPRSSLKSLLLSAVFAVASVWSKQTMAPLLIALLAFVWIVDGAPQFWRYLLCLLGSGLTISVLLVAALRPFQAMWFNMFVVPSHQPYGTPEQLVRSLSLLSAESLPCMLIITFLVLYSLFYGQKPLQSPREIVANNRWLIFAMVAVSMIPTFVLGSMKVDGDVNHISLIAYFVTICASAGLSSYLTQHEPNRDTPMKNAAKILATILMLVGLARMPLSLFDLRKSRDLAGNPSQIAYNYEKAHPGVAYFPWNPLAVLLAGGKLYHGDVALIDRELAGFGLNREQFQRHIPKDARLVAFPPDARPFSAILNDHLRGFEPAPGTVELPGWTVFQRASGAD